MIKQTLALAVFLVVAPVNAESKMTSVIKEGLWGELGAQFAALPGLKQLQEHENAKKYKLVTNRPNKGTLKYQPEQGHNSAWVAINGGGRNIKLYGDAILPVGQHTMFIVPEDPNLRYHKSVMYIGAGKTRELTVDKFYDYDALFPLRIMTKPANATVKIMNIKPKYAYGMRLPYRKDGYKVQISKRGYKTVNKVIDLSSEGQTFHYTLKRNK